MCHDRNTGRELAVKQVDITHANDMQAQKVWIFSKWKLVSSYHLLQLIGGASSRNGNGNI